MRLKHTLIFIWQASRIMITIKMLELAKMIAPKDYKIDVAISEAVIESCDYVIARSPKRKPLEYYLGLQYQVTLYPDPWGGFVAEIKDLPGCTTQGETKTETLELIEDARRLWLTTAHKHGDNIPEPSIN